MAQATILYAPDESEDTSSVVFTFTNQQDMFECANIVMRDLGFQKEEDWQIGISGWSKDGVDYTVEITGLFVELNKTYLQ